MPYQYPQNSMQQPPGGYPSMMNYQTGGQSFQPQMVQQQMPQGINGRFINSIQEVAAQDVPMDGSASVFPLRDGSGIYVKCWLPNGTIQTLFYERAVDRPNVESSKWEDVASDVLGGMKALTDRVTALENNRRQNRPNNQYKREKEVNNDGA